MHMGEGLFTEARTPYLSCYTTEENISTFLLTATSIYLLILYGKHSLVHPSFLCDRMLLGPVLYTSGADGKTCCRLRSTATISYLKPAFPSILPILSLLHSSVPILRCSLIWQRMAIHCFRDTISG